MTTVYAAGVLACISSGNVNAALVLLDNFDSGRTTGEIGGGLFAQVVGSADLVVPSTTFAKTSGNPESANTSNHNVGNLVEDLSFAIGVPEASTGAMIFLWLAAVGVAKSRKVRSPISIDFGGVDRPPETGRDLHNQAGAGRPVLYHLAGGRQAEGT